MPSWSTCFSSGSISSSSAMAARTDRHRDRADKSWRVLQIAIGQARHHENIVAQANPSASKVLKDMSRLNHAIINQIVR